MSESLGYADEPGPEEPEGPSLVDDWQHIASTPQGERVLENLSHFCHFKTPTLDSHDSQRNAQNEGKRLVYLYILALLEHDERKGDTT